MSVRCRSGGKPAIGGAEEVVWSGRREGSERCRRLREREVLASGLRLLPWHSPSSSWSRGTYSRDLLHPRTSVASQHGVFLECGGRKGMSWSVAGIDLRVWPWTLGAVCPDEAVPNMMSHRARFRFFHVVVIGRDFVDQGI